MGVFSLLTFFLILFVSCGKTTDTEIKVFKFSIEATSQEKTKIQALMRDYNVKIGFSAISEAAEGEVPNSSIVVINGLTQKNPGKVGFGRWTADTQTHGLCPICTPDEKETNYSMRAEFDQEFFDKRMNSKDAADQTELTTLFDHEIGHGLTMDHDPKEASVMRAEITCLDRSSTTCGKDFNAYFSNARRFFTSKGNL